VLDRATGKPVSIKPFVPINWATGTDPATGRPDIVAAAHYDKTGKLWSAQPGSIGGHNWQPMAYSQETGLVYIPAQEVGGAYVTEKDFKARPVGVNLGVDFVQAGLPDDKAKVKEIRSHMKGYLLAWDPVNQKEVWRVDYPGPNNGGVLTTAGNLVFQGLADGYLHAYSADRGEDLWSFYAGVSITGMPMTFSIDGRQYVAITAGPLNGATATFGSLSARWGWDSRAQPRRLLAFALDGSAQLPPSSPAQLAKPLFAPEFQLDNAKAEAGSREFLRCMLCHGSGAVAGGNAPDLRASVVPLSDAAFAQIVRGGALTARGMPQFSELTDAQLESLRHFIRAMARESYEESGAHVGKICLEI